MAIPCTQFSSNSIENNLLTGSPKTPIENNKITQNELKKIAAYKAVEYVKSGMILGLGTSSTAKHAIDRIGELISNGKLTNIIGIPTSKKTEEQAICCGIPLSDLNSHQNVDLVIDGADEVDPYLNLVKGRGGSLLWKKMIEGATKRFIVIVDESKMVEYLGGSGLAMPVEVVPFCWRFSAERLRKMFEEKGCVVKLRCVGRNGENGEEEEAYVTDNGNYIVDLYLKEDLGDLSLVSDSILRVPGVVEHGMFLGMAKTVIVAGELGISIKDKEI